MLLNEYKPTFAVVTVELLQHARSGGDGGRGHPQGTLQQLPMPRVVPFRYTAAAVVALVFIQIVSQTLSDTTLGALTQLSS